MKLKKILALTALGAVLLPGLTSCGGVEEGGASKIQIKCYKGGYGDEWIRELVAKFNETFADQNLSAEIVESSALVTESSKQELYNFKKNQIDLYFTNGSDYSAVIDRSQATLKTNSKTLLAKYLADKYNGLFIDIDDYANSSVKNSSEVVLKDLKKGQELEVKEISIKHGSDAA